METRYNYRLRVNQRQATCLQQIFDANRFVWNHSLGRWNDLWRHEGIHHGNNAMSAELTDMRGRFDWLDTQPSVPQQQAIRDLTKSISAFFDKKNPSGRPRPKKKGQHASACWVGSAFELHHKWLRVGTSPRPMILRVVMSRPLPSTPTSVTVYRDSAGRWWCSFVVRIEPELVGRNQISTGLDVGLNVYATTEFPDADIANPRFARNAAKALARSQRNQSRKITGSKNRAKARRHTARVHAKVANQRKDFQHKEARKLARRFDQIGVENLQISNMVKNKRLARSISDAGWGNFLRALEWQAKKCGHEVIQINPRNTSQTCSRCGAKAKRKLTLADRTFHCEECGLVLDRDRNAARNLNPNRLGCTGESVDGSKTEISAENPAA